ncbi:hypothetical protein ACFW9I_02820 [[Kitasatospora] papulosa]|uniref:hypothetical protein n=1 Tax=Streptomyces TaxID=1883 RepID=UPI00340281FC
MAAQLTGTVYVTDPDTHQTVELAPGTCPEPRLAALVTNPAAWVDGKLPRLPRTKTDTGSGSDQDDASGDDSDTSAATEPSEGDDSEDTKPAARKTAARKPARGRTTADEGTGGQ